MFKKKSDQEPGLPSIKELLAKRKAEANAEEENTGSFSPAELTAEVNEPKKIRRRLRGNVVALVALILLLLIVIFKVPPYVTSRKLEKLGYDTAAIKAIKKQHLTGTILDNDYYSAYLNQAVQEDNFKKDYLKLYLYREKLTDDDFYLYQKLLTKTYTTAEADQLFKELTNREIIPLLVYAKQDNLDNYIKDCQNNHKKNLNNAFILNGNYFKAYEDVKTAPNIGSLDVLVNKKFTLGKYAPKNLKTLNTRYAIEGIELEERAYEAFMAMCNAMAGSQLGVYAIGGYRSYQTQEEIYNWYNSPSEADLNTFRPGFSERQTGLSVLVVDGTNENVAEFKNTPEYAWLLANADRFGFILRYPEHHETLLGNEGIPNQFRYVGKPLATRIKESGLTFEEYYFLYLDKEGTAKD